MRTAYEQAVSDDGTTTQVVERLFQLYNSRLVSYLVNVLPDRNRALAEDIAQDTWLYLLRYAQPGIEVDRAFGLVTFHGRRAVSDYFRRACRGHREVPTDFAAANHTEPEAPKQARPVSLPSMYRALLDLLPEDERQALVLRCEEGLTFDAIGSHLGRTRTWASIHTHKGAAALRPMLAQAG